MKTNLRTWAMAGVIAVGSLAVGTSPAKAQGFGFSFSTGPGYSGFYGGGGYPLLTPPPIVVAPSPVFVPQPYIVPQPYYRTYRPYGGYPYGGFRGGYYGGFRGGYRGGFGGYPYY